MYIIHKRDSNTYYDKQLDKPVTISELADLFNSKRKDLAIYSINDGVTNERFTDITLSTFVMVYSKYLRDVVKMHPQVAYDLYDVLPVLKTLVKIQGVVADVQSSAKD